MYLDTFTVIMGLLLGSFLTMALHLLSRRSYFLRKFGIHTVMLLYLLCVLRMVLPVKFPFTVPIGVPALDSLESVMNAPLFHTGWNLKQLMIAVWLTGAAISLLIFAAREIMLARRLRKNPGMRHLLAEAVMENIRKSSSRKLPVRVRMYPGLGMPVGVGLLHPLICLPDRYYTAKELSYILRHEYAHFLGRDLHIKLLMRVYAGLFWWDPAAWLLLEDIGQTLELRCDWEVTKGFSLSERREYLTVILRSILDEGRGPEIFWMGTKLGSFRDRSGMLERFWLVADPGENPGQRHTGMTVVSAVLFAGSYLFLFQPTAAADSFILPDGVLETLLLLALSGGAAVWAWRRSDRVVHLPRRRLGALMTAAAVFAAGLGVRHTDLQVWFDHAPVTAMVTSWDGSRSRQIAIDTAHYDGLTSLNVHDVLCTSGALGVNPEGPYQYFPYVANRRGHVMVKDADTIITAANCFEAVSAVPADSVEYEPGLGPEFLMGNEALCGISDHYARLTGLRIGDRVTMPIYTTSFYSYGKSCRYIGGKTLRIAALYPYGQVDGLRAPDMTVPAGWLRDMAEGAGADFCYSSLSAKLDDYRQADQVWDAGFIPSGTDGIPSRYSNTVTMLT